MGDEPYPRRVNLLESLGRLQREAQRLWRQEIADDVIEYVDDVSSLLQLDVFVGNSPDVVAETPLRLTRTGSGSPVVFPADNLSQDEFMRAELQVLHLFELIQGIEDFEARHARLAIEGDVLDEKVAEVANEVSGLADRTPRELIASIDDLVSRYRETCPADVADLLRRSLSRVRTPLGRKLLDNRAQSAVEKAEEAAEAAAESAGITGTATLASYFQAFSNKERLESRLWFFALIAVLIASLYAGYEHVGSVQGLEWTEIWQRLAVGLPIAIFISVAIHEVGLHRTHALWAKHVAVQLQTIRAFSEELPASEKITLRAELGRAIFVGPPPIAIPSVAQRRRLRSALPLSPPIDGG